MALNIKPEKFDSYLLSGYLPNGAASFPVSCSLNVNIHTQRKQATYTEQDVSQGHSRMIYTLLALTFLCISEAWCLHAD